MKVRMRLTRAPFTSVRRALRRIRFFACGVLAIFVLEFPYLKRHTHAVHALKERPLTLPNRFVNLILPHYRWHFGQ
jgi:hypothetical protein